MWHRMGSCGAQTCRAAVMATALMAAACAQMTGPAGGPEIFGLEPGVVRLTDQLVGRIPPEGVQRRVVAVDLFTDAASGEVPRAAQRIESVMLAQPADRYKPFQLVRLAPKQEAAYLVFGSIFPESAPGRFRLYGAVKDLRRNRIVSSASVQVSARDIDYTPMAFYRDNPFFDSGYRKKKISGQSPRKIGPPGFEQYSLHTLALLRGASTAYEHGDYDAARALFSEAEGRPDGRTIWAYAGLYLALEKLGRTDEAEKAFDRIVSVSVEKHHMLTVRFLFRVDSVAFWGGPETAVRYQAWLRHIGQYFSRTDHC